MTIRAGTVYLVGAGPGDAGLITVRGLELLARADVIVHDRLIAAGLLTHARAEAEVIDAGKSAGDHTLDQEEINALLVTRARAGRMVVRLKGGDPFVFGRGAEEAAACAEAGVVCEVVPGVSSATAGPALAGIALTSRGSARHAAIVTGQTGASDPVSPEEWAALARIDTVVVMMGVGAIADIARALIRAGRGEGTPVAIVERAGMPGQRRTDATLGTAAARAHERGVAAPAVIVIGEVARPVTGGPLAGRRIVVTRPRSASAELLTRLRALGAEAIDCPLIEVGPLDPGASVELRPGRYDWIIFSSRHGVRGFFAWLASRGLDLRAAAGAKIAAVGPTTSAELRAHGAIVDLIPDVHRAASLADALCAASGGRRLRVLFACGTLAREELGASLRAAGHVVDDLIVYETRLLDMDARARHEFARGVDAVLLASPSAARALRASGVDIGGAVLGCIGESTGRAAAREGFAVGSVAADHSDSGLIEGLIDRFASIVPGHGTR